MDNTWPIVEQQIFDYASLGAILMQDGENDYTRASTGGQAMTVLFISKKLTIKVI